jgi:hypothetical protein
MTHAIEKSVIELLEARTGITWIRYADATAPTAPRPGTPYGTIRFQSDSETTKVRLLGYDSSDKPQYRVNKNVTMVMQIIGGAEPMLQLTRSAAVMRDAGGALRDIGLVYLDRLAATDIPQYLNSHHERRAQADLLLGYTYEFTGYQAEDMLAEVRYNLEERNADGSATYEVDVTIS